MLNRILKTLHKNKHFIMLPITVIDNIKIRKYFEKKQIYCWTRFHYIFCNIPFNKYNGTDYTGHYKKF